MTLQLTPESGVPLSKRAPKLDLKDRAAACAKTIELLSQHGLDTSTTAEDRDTAAALAVAYAQNPEKTSKATTTARTAQLTPAVIKKRTRFSTSSGVRGGLGDTVRTLSLTADLGDREPGPKGAYQGAGAAW